MTVAMVIGAKVSEARRDKGMTQAELARAAGVSSRLVASLEAGTAEGIQLNKLLPTLEALGLTLAVVEAEDDRERAAGRGQYEDLFASATSYIRDERSWARRIRESGTGR